MTQVVRDHPIAVAMTQNRHAEQFYEAERERVEREYMRAEDARFGRKRKRPPARIEQRLARKQQERNRKKMGSTS